MTRTLPNHLTELLRTCREFNTTETKTLAAQLSLSPATVNAYFQRAAELLGTTDRFSTVQHAFRQGLLINLEDNLLINGNFVEGNQGHGPGNSLPWTSVMGWLPLRGGSPQWVMPEIEGGPGAIMMWGVGDTGEAIYQVLPPNYRTRPGRVYRFSAEYRFGPVKRDWPLVPRQPMFVDFVVRLSKTALENYTSPDVPGQVVTIGRLHYAPRPADSIVTVPSTPLTPEKLETIRLRGGEHAVEQHYATLRAGGISHWVWEEGTLGDWTADSEYTVLTIHPTNDLLVGTDGSNKDAPLELAWGQIRHVRFIEVNQD